MGSRRIFQFALFCTNCMKVAVATCSLCCWPIEIAHVYAWVDEVGDVFLWLEKELETNSLNGVTVDPFFISLHDDPRWQHLMEKAGTSDEQLAAIDFNVSLPK